MPHSLTWIVQSLIMIISVTVVALGSQEAHLKVKHLHYDNPKLNQDVDFPLVLGSTDAAKNINLHLQNRLLDANGFFVDNSTIHPHEEVKLPNISYELYPSGHALFSVRFSLTESGEEEYLESFLFDAHTGKLVPLKKLFSPQGICAG